MGILGVVVTVLLVIVSVALIGLILVQRGKGGGLVAFGGSGVEQAFGAHAVNLAQKATAILVGVFLVLSIWLAVLNKPASSAAPSGSAPSSPAAPAASGAPEAPASDAPATPAPAGETAP